MKWCSQATAPAGPHQRRHARADRRTPSRSAPSGIGLTRTEHMFFEGDRIDAMREMILADNLDDREAALAKLLPYQRDDFFGIFKALKGFPATIRFLDPPLHEFLPQPKEPQADLAQEARHPASRRSRSACTSCTSSTRCSASAAAASASSIPKSPRCRRAPCSRPPPMRPEEGHQGEARNHDPARRLQEGTRSAGRHRPRSRRRRCRRRRR